MSVAPSQIITHLSVAENLGVCTMVVRRKSVLRRCFDITLNVSDMGDKLGSASWKIGCSGGDENFVVTQCIGRLCSPGRAPE